ncbi:amidohydrolase family protein [Gracilibacillus sp. YIM 98692]|uniref:amidohydrolase family protein n=1 Tax=Gracilibacillus sp. YIM 98692 TaxID=2663532 RepID=UPI0013D7F67B|nr:amidohydrolase family protein [Gracilibacillus sp. YIM 98692]
MHDFHTHFIPEQVITWLKDNQQIVSAKWVDNKMTNNQFLTVNGKWGFELKPQFIDSVLYLQEQDAMCVSHSIVSPIPQLFLYDFSDEITSELSTVYNQSLATWTKSTPNRLSALGTVPLNNPKKAAEVLRDAMNIGLKGVIIGPGIGEQMLTDATFTPFFEEANRLHAILFIHPLLCEDPRLRRKMPNLIGVPWETTVCATDILLSGLIDKYPNVKIIFAHGGGFLPYQLGRLDKGYEQWTDVSRSLQLPPSTYAKRFWYDTVLLNEQSLHFLIETVGADRIVPGSDYPFDLSSWPPQGEFYQGVRSLLES